MSESVKRNWKHETDVADGSPLLASDCPELRAVVYERGIHGPESQRWAAVVWWQGEMNQMLSSTFHPTVWKALEAAEAACAKATAATKAVSDRFAEYMERNGGRDD